MTFYQDLLRRNRLLTMMGSGYFALFLILLTVSFFDTRALLGINLWIKPMKFALSIGIVAWTFAYLISELPYSSRKENRFSQIIFWTMLIEIIAIVGQAARGQQSHFNVETPLGSIIYTIMGISIFTTFIIICLVTMDYFFKKTTLSKSLLWAIRIGLLVMIFGNIGGMLMAQMLTHTIGATDGGAGLPLVNWSTIAGDLRVMHFFGLHGIQLFPLLALGMIKVNFLKNDHQRTAVIGAIGVMYAAFVVITFLQALNAQPFLKFIIP